MQEISLLQQRYYERKKGEKKPYGQGFTPIFTKLTVNHPRVIPITPLNLNLVGPSVWEKIEKLHTNIHTNIHKGAWGYREALPHS